MSNFADSPIRRLTNDELSRDREDDVIMVEQVISPRWLGLLEAGLTGVLATMSILGSFQHGTRS